MYQLVHKTRISLYRIIIIFICTLCSMTFVSSAALQGNLDLTYDSLKIPHTIRPESDVITIPVNISYFVSGFLAQVVVPFIDSRTVHVNVSLENVPEYIVVENQPDIVYPKVRLTKPTDPESVILSVSVSPDAPAFQKISFNVVAEALVLKGPLGRLTLIEGVVNRIPIEITPGYYSNFQFNYKNFYELKPGHTVTIPIVIRSYSNARSNAQFYIENVPENWSASILNEVFIGTAALGEFGTITVDLIIQGPLDPGYYNELRQISVNVVTKAAGHPEQGVDNSTTLQFTVRCRGTIVDNSAVDSMHISLQIGLVIIGGGLFLLFVFWRKRRSQR